MKNLNYIINGVLLIAIIVLFSLHFTGKSCDGNVQGEATTTHAQGEVFPFAYINVDSLLVSYNYAKDLNEALVRKQESSRLTINQKSKQLEQEAIEFQKKIENNAFLNRERAEQEQNRLMRKQQELEQLGQRLTAEYAQEQQAMNEKLRDNIYAFIKEYNATKKFQIIFSNTMNDNILYADKVYDVTDEVIVELNKRYSPTTDLTEKK